MSVLWRMLRHVAGPEWIVSSILASTVLLSLTLNGCKLFKKGDDVPDAQALALPTANASAPAPATASIAPEIPSVTLPTPPEPVHLATASNAKPKATASASPSATGAVVAPNTTAAAPSSNASASAPPVTLPAINPQCQATCQKSYQDCVAQSGTVTGVDLIRKCRAVLVPCVSACTK